MKWFQFIIYIIKSRWCLMTFFCWISFFYKSGRIRIHWVHLQNFFMVHTNDLLFFRYYFHSAKMRKKNLLTNFILIFIFVIFFCLPQCFSYILRWIFKIYFYFCLHNVYRTSNTWWVWLLIWCRHLYIPFS